jgi:hypothetical protein
LYNSKAEAAAGEGAIADIDGSVYDSIQEAESYFHEGGVFAFNDAEGIRVAWAACREG